MKIRPGSVKGLHLAARLCHPLHKPLRSRLEELCLWWLLSIVKIRMPDSAFAYILSLLFKNVKYSFCIFKYSNKVFLLRRMGSLLWTPIFFILEAVI